MAKELKVHVKNRIKLGDTKYVYTGTLAFGEYTAGGSPITSVDGAVTALPTAGFDYFNIGSSTGYSAAYEPGATPVLKVYGGASAAKGAGAEVADATSLAAVPITFFGIGS